MMNNDKFGKDLKLKLQRDERGFIRTDLSISRSGDLDLVSNHETVLQSLRNRLATQQGEMAELGHPEYGSLLDSVIGEPNVPDTHRIIETLVKDCLTQEPRVANILDVAAVPNKHYQNCVDIRVYLKLHGEPENLKLDLNFELEGTL